MRKALTALVAAITVGSAALLAIGTIKDLKLSDGHDKVNQIGSPLFNGGSIALSFNVGEAFNRKEKFVRRGATSFMTRGPEYNLDAGVKIGALFTEALKSESTALGFRAASAPSDGWRIEGTIKDIYMESKQIPYGATLFYGYMDVDFQIRNKGGAPESRRMRFHTFFGAYNAGFGTKDEASESVAHLIVESAQETVARLNRAFFKAAPAAGVAAILEKVKGGATGNDLHLLGLSGLPAATPALLAALPAAVTESQRSAIIDALARLGSPAAVPVLASRYATEKEDCRFYSLKAMDYIGTADAMALVKDAGAKDKDGGPRRIAERILGIK